MGKKKIVNGKIVNYFIKNTYHTSQQLQDKVNEYFNTQHY